MLNKNYKRMTIMAGGTGPTDLVNDKGSSSDFRYSFANLWNTAAQCCSLSESSTYNGSFLAFGTGDTAETVDDYTLVEPIENLTCINTTLTYGTFEVIKSVTSTVKNSTDNDITIKEIGLFGNYNGDNTILFARKVLENPVTIAPGEIYAFNYTIE